MLRLRLPELLDAANLTPYALATRSGGRISLSTAYRLVAQQGRATTYNAAVIEALCDALGVEPGELFEYTTTTRKAPKRARR